MKTTVVEIRELRRGDVIHHPVTKQLLRVEDVADQDGLFDVWVTSPDTDPEEADYQLLFPKAPGHKVVNRLSEDLCQDCNHHQGQHRFGVGLDGYAYRDICYANVGDMCGCLQFRFASDPLV